MRSRKVKPNPDAWIRIINKTLKNDRYEFAEEYLHSVRDTITSTGRVTKKQMEAINNIRRSGQ